MSTNLQETGGPGSAAALPQLNRALRPSAKAPVRIVHLGLGAFHRSHQAWYTHQASDAAGWGIAAFTGRRPDAALALASRYGVELPIAAQVAELLAGRKDARTALCELMLRPQRAETN